MMEANDLDVYHKNLHELGESYLNFRRTISTKLNMLKENAVAVFKSYEDFAKYKEVIQKTIREGLTSESEENKAVLESPVQNLSQTQKVERRKLLKYVNQLTNRHMKQVNSILHKNNLSVSQSNKSRGEESNDSFTSEMNSDEESEDSEDSNSESNSESYSDSNSYKSQNKRRRNLSNSNNDLDRSNLPDYTSDIDIQLSSTQLSGVEHLNVGGSSSMKRSSILFSQQSASQKYLGYEEQQKIHKLKNPQFIMDVDLEKLRLYFIIFRKFKCLKIGITFYYRLSTLFL
jgi:hypothetical protein